MTTLSIPSAPLRATISARLGGIRRRLLLVGVGVAVGWGVAAGLAVLIVGAWLDLALDFPGNIRLLFDLAAIAAVLVVAVRLQLLAVRSASVRRMARTLDKAAHAHGQIVAGLDLAASSLGSAATLTGGLRRIATREAVTLMGRVSPQTAAPATPLRKPLAAWGLGAAFLLLLAASLPRLLHTQWLRFIDPLGDHPPYSALIFTVQPGNTTVIYGNPVDVQATTSGAVAERVDLVYRAPGQADQTIPMFPQSDGKWQATIASVVAPGQYFLQSGRSRTPRFDLGVITVPKIQKVTFNVTLPAYTNRPPYDGPLPESGLAGLPGTKVVVRAQSNRPLSGGELTFTAAGISRRIHMTAADDNQAVGEFEIHAAGKFELKVVDTQGQMSTDSFGGSVILLTDQKPFVRLVEPLATSFATPDALIKVLAVAEDDYGISKLEIYRGLNDSRFRSTEIPVPTPAATQFPGSLLLRPSDYGLEPGDVVKLFARTQDNDPAGPKGAESSVAMIHIVSQEDLDRMRLTRDAMETLQSKYAQAARRLEALTAQADRLGKEIAAQDPNKPLPDELRKELDQLSNDLAKAGADIDKLAHHDLPIDLDQALKGQLSAMASAVNDASRLAGQAAQPGIAAAAAADKLKQLQAKLGAEKEDFDKNATQPLDYLAKIYPLLQDEMQFIDLYDSQKDLAERMSALESKNGQDDPQIRSRMRDLQDEQGRVRDDLQHLLDDIDNHAKALPDDKRLDDLRKTATEFAQAVRASPADGQMQDTQTALDQFAGTRASMNAHAAADTLNQFIARCNGMGQQASTCLGFQPTLAAGLGDSLSQMLGLGQGEGINGMGGGSGGYSARRSSLQNVGLYGTIPLASAQSAGGGGKADRGAASSATGSPNGRNNPDAADSRGAQHAAGQGDAPVPPQYKKSVGEYYQRVEDELSQ